MSAEHGNLMGRRIFVVEDEWLVSELLLDTLSEVGCEVVGTASRLEEATNKSKSLSFDVAILDVNLNGQMTFPLAEELAARGIAFVLSTGYGQACLPDALKNRPILQKPFLQPDLERALRVALQ